MIDYARTKRIPQEGDGETDRLCKLLNEAASIARTTLESIQALAGTTVCKVVQIAALEKWAKEKGCWIDDISLIGVYSSQGSGTMWSPLSISFQPIVRIFKGGKLELMRIRVYSWCD